MATSHVQDEQAERGGQPKLLSHKVFTFLNEDFKLSVKIPEVAEAAYGMYTWPCAPVLAQFVFSHRQEIAGKCVLEIGSGTALAGVVAAKCGGNVLLSDSAIFPDCLQNCRASCLANNLENVKVIPLTWGLMTPTVLSLPPVDIILGSDCFYDTKDFEDVLVTVSYLLKRNPKGQFWCTYQKRSAMRSIEFYLRKWNLCAKEVNRKSFLSDSNMDSWKLHGSDSVHMFIITLARGMHHCHEVT